VKVTGSWKRNLVAGCGRVAGEIIAWQVCGLSASSPKGEAVEASLESGLDVELLFCLLGALDNSGGELVGVWEGP
jgi:hypothetical protein